MNSSTRLLVTAAFSALLALAGCGADKSASPPAPQSAPQTQPAAPQAETAPAAVPAAAPAAAPAQSEALKPDPDVALAAAVKDALEAEKGLDAQGIDVTAKGGMVTLWGTVPRADRRTLAVKTARRVPGVKAVQNNLQVVSGS